MQYVKEYSNMEDLEDYLQEIFDKYNIMPYIQSDSFYDGRWHEHPYYRKFENFIHINNLKKISIDLLKDVIKAIPTIETRMGHKIEIEYHGHKRGNKIFNLNQSNSLTIFTGEPSLDLRSKLGLY